MDKIGATAPNKNLLPCGQQYTEAGQDDEKVAEDCKTDKLGLVEITEKYSKAEADTTVHAESNIDKGCLGVWV